MLRRRRPPGQDARASRVGRQARVTVVPPIPVPRLSAAGDPSPRLRRRTGAAPAPAPATAARPSGATRYFVMTLSDHDCSKRTGVAGTPEISLPDAAAQFFPAMQRTQRMYPDAYFEAMLNSPQRASSVDYRLWRRPGGAAGHADLRINVKHDTIDLTTPGGGDLILFERTATSVGPQYEVWIVKPNDPNHQDLRAHCNHRVTARGSGGVKYYGFF